jgi:carbohydrate-binding DOMON domain-containing protein
MKTLQVVLVFFALIFLAASVFAKDIELVDPKGDDKGPGTYVYPTAAVYKKGSFDIVKVLIKDKGNDVQIKVHLKAKLEDPWKSRDWQTRGNGFSLQMGFLFIDQDHKAGSGYLKGIPGLNVRFKDDARWEKVVIISPQGNARLISEIDEKAKEMKKDIVLPKKVKVSGKKIIATVSKKDLGGLADGWGYQLVMQSNDGYPDSDELLTRKINENRGEHRFGGGRDDDCDPHVLDILTSPAKGSDAEIEEQYKVLKAYKCDGEESKWKLAELPMVYP